MNAVTLNKYNNKQKNITARKTSEHIFKYYLNGIVINTFE